MALPAFFKNREEAPEYLREHLIEIEEDQWMVEVDGAEIQKRLVDFRNNNRSLHGENKKTKKELEDLQQALTVVQAKYKDVDPDEYRTLKEAPADIQKQLLEAEARLKVSYEKNYGDRIAQLEADNKAKEQKFQMEKIKSEVARVAPKLGVRPTSMRNLQRDAVETMAIIDDQPVPILKGEPRYSEKSPSRFMDVEEWIGTQVAENPDYFEPSSGGGANGGLGGVGRNGHRVIPASDTRALLSNLEAVASGKMEVDMSA
jgi:hypothetical protein